MSHQAMMQSRRDGPSPAICGTTRPGDCTITEGETGQSFAVDGQSSAFDAASRAYRQASGSDFLDIGCGTPIPFIAVFAHVYPDAAILIASAGADGDSRAHSENESVSLANFERACLAPTLLLTELRQ